MKEQSHIVLVEDDPAHSTLILAALKQAGVSDKVVHMEDGTAALDYIRTYSDGNNLPLPRLFILDLRLPDIDGIEILKTIKTNKILASIPVVILSTSDTDEDKSRAIEHGADGYYTKPWDFDGLCKVLGEISSRWLI